LFVILLLLLVATIGFSVFAIKLQKDAGISAVRGYIDNDVRQHVIAEYGDATSVEDLFCQLKAFACNNFQYNYRQADSQYVQWFDYMDFVRGEMNFGGGPYSGICYDFAAYTSTVVEIIANYKGWSNVRVDVVSIKSLKNGSRHACNFIYVEDDVYYIDLTWDSTEYQQGRMEYVFGAVLLKNQTPEQYCRSFGYAYRRVL
jgi:hypothetical protein